MFLAKIREISQFFIWKISFLSGKYLFLSGKLYIIFIWKTSFLIAPVPVHCFSLTFTALKNRNILHRHVIIMEVLKVYR